MSLAKFDLANVSPLTSKEAIFADNFVTVRQVPFIETLSPILTSLANLPKSTSSRIASAVLVIVFTTQTDCIKPVNIMVCYDYVG